MPKRQRRVGVARALLVMGPRGCSGRREEEPEVKRPAGNRTAVDGRRWRGMGFALGPGADWVAADSGGNFAGMRGGRRTTGRRADVARLPFPEGALKT